MSPNTDESRRDRFRSSYVFELLGYIGAIVSIGGYFIGPFSAIVPPPWRVPLTMVTFLMIVFAAVATTRRAVSRHLDRFDASVEKRLGDFRDDVGRALEEATKIQADADAVLNATEEIGSLANDLQKAIEEIRLSGNSPEAARTHLHHALTRFARAIKRLSGHEMRACIKIIKTDAKGRRFAVTIARSNTTFLDDDERNLIAQNTDFKAISAGQATWHSPSISQESDYSNSSPKSGMYESVLVWGIRNVVDPQAADSLLGFLCLDSVDVDAIDVRRDKIFGWWFIDAFRSLYLVVPEAINNFGNPSQEMS